MASRSPSRPSTRGAQRSSPNDSRNGSTRRALTAPLEPWVNGSRDGGFPREARSRRQRRRCAALAKEMKQPHETGVVSRARFSSCRRYGAAGEQKHLPDWFNTTATRNGTGSVFYEVRNGRLCMARKRIERKASATAMDRQPTGAEVELVRLAAVLERIATMDALPLAPSPPRRRKRRCAI